MSWFGSPWTPFLAASEGDFWFPPQVSTFAADVDWTYYFIYYVSLVFFILIMSVMAYFCVVYRRRKGHQASHEASHSNFLETAWSIIPAFLVVFMFYWGFTGFMDMRSMPDEAYEIAVTGKKWNWEFIYENGKVVEAGGVDAAETAGHDVWSDRDQILKSVPKLHVPVNRDILLTMNSIDVLHSFFVPAFRTKQDVVPGRYTKLWFKATEEGVYDVFCAEYCGTKHSEMLAQVVVESQESFDKWFAVASDLEKRFDGDFVKIGEFLYNSRGCKQCHSIDGTDNPKSGGPSFKGHWGEQVTFTDGSAAPMDENYIRESILYPQRHIRQGFGPIMSTGLLTKEKDIGYVIAFIKSLNQKAEK